MRRFAHVCALDKVDLRGRSLAAGRYPGLARTVRIDAFVLHLNTKDGEPPARLYRRHPPETGRRRRVMSAGIAQAVFVDGPSHTHRGAES